MPIQPPGSEGGQQGLGLLSIECKAQRAAAHPAIPTVPAYAQTQAHPFEPSGAVAETPASAGTHAHVPKVHNMSVPASPLLFTFPIAHTFSSHLLVFIHLIFILCFG